MGYQIIKQIFKASELQLKEQGKFESQVWNWEVNNNFHQNYKHTSLNLQSSSLLL